MSELATKESAVKPAGYETTFEVTVYSHEPISPTQYGTLHGLEREMETGELVGDWFMYPSRPIESRDDMRKMLKSIGNDGEFFDPQWETDDELSRSAPDDRQTSADLG